MHAISRADTAVLIRGQEVKRRLIILADVS